MTAEEQVKKFTDTFPRYGTYLPGNCGKQLEELMIEFVEEQSVLEHLFAAKRKLEQSKHKEDFNTLSYLEEAIKWQQSKNGKI